MRGAGRSGVPTSSRVMTGVSAVTGSRSRYSSMTPRHPLVTALLLTCDDRPPSLRATAVVSHVGSTCWDPGGYLSLCLVRPRARIAASATLAAATAAGALWLTGGLDAAATPPAVRPGREV